MTEVIITDIVTLRKSGVLYSFLAIRWVVGECLEIDILAEDWQVTLVLKLAFGFEQLQVVKGAGMAMHSRQGSAV